jgi:predicted transcriptional regulator
MSDTDRVRAWRDRLKQAGLVPMTIWVKAETKARYEDLALTYHRSPSELAHQALDAYHPTAATVSASVADTEQLQALIRAELTQLTADVTATVTATITETLMGQLQELVQAAVVTVVSATVTDTETATGPVTATETDTETVTPPTGTGDRQTTAPAPAVETAAATATLPIQPPRRGGRPPSPERQQILTLLAAHPDGLSAEELRVYVKPTKPIGDTLQGMRKTGVLRTRDDGKTLRYVLASPAQP